MFIAAFQKMLPLLYLDKLLDEIQLLFRDKFSKDLQVKFFKSYLNVTESCSYAFKCYGDLPF